MPQAVISQETERHDLKSAPPDGFVELRRMPYGMSLQRRDMAIRASIEQDKRGGDAKTVLDQYTLRTQQYSFAYCIVDHNLQDEKGQKLNFDNTATLDVLDPAVGDEIERLIDEMHKPKQSKVLQNGQVIEDKESAVFDQPSVQS